MPTKQKNLEKSPREINFEEIHEYSLHKDYHKNLRAYQQEIKKSIYEEWGNGFKNIMIQMPTGTGKTHLFSSIIKDLVDYFYDKLAQPNFDYNERPKYKVPKILVLVHRIELVEQIFNTLCDTYSHSCGMIAGQNRINEGRDVIVATTQTMGRERRLYEWGKNVDFDFIIIDEAHHSTAESYQRIMNTWPKARLLGVTATPYRLNHESFTDTYQKLIISEPICNFIKNGSLCNYDYISIKPNSTLQEQINQLKINRTSGDFDDADMEQLLDQDQIRANILNTYERFAKGLKGIVYTINRRHNEHLSNLFSGKGYRVAYIDSETDKEERRQTVQKFRNGEIDIIFNVNIFSEGFDCPDVQFILLARPTKSLSMYLQQVGRGFRISAGKKKVLLLDNVGLYNQFGLPSARRDWQKYFDGSADAQDDISLDNGPLDGAKNGEIDDNISEGNEEMSLIYTSSEDEIPVQSPTQDDQEDSIVKEEETIIQCDYRQFYLDRLSVNEVMEMLIFLEKNRPTNMIDIEVLQHKLQEDDKVKKVMDVIRNGYSTEFLEKYTKLLMDNVSAHGDDGENNDTNDIDEEIEGENEGKPLEPNPLKRLLIIRDDEGQIIQETKCSQALITAISQIGIEKVYKICKEAPESSSLHGLVTILTNNDAQYFKAPKNHIFDIDNVRYYVNTTSNTLAKKKQLEKLSELLDLNWTIEVM